MALQAYGQDIFDFQTGQKIGAFGRQWLAAMLRDEWTVLDPYDRPIGIMAQDNASLAFLRQVMGVRFGMPRFHLTVNGQDLVTLQLRLNFFSPQALIQFHTPPAYFDRRLGIAAGALLASVDSGRNRSPIAEFIPRPF